MGQHQYALTCGAAGVGRRDIGVADNGCPVSVSLRVSRVVGTACSPKRSLHRSKHVFSVFTALRSGFSLNLPTPRSQHHERQLHPLDGRWVSRTHVLSQSLRTTFPPHPAGPPDAHDARPRGQHHEHRQLPLFRPAGATCCMMHAWRPASPIREHYASSAVVLCLRLRCLRLLGSQPSNKSPLRVHTIDATAWELGSML